MANAALSSAWLFVLLTLIGCDAPPPTGDAGPPPICAPSDTAGCQAACTLFYECFVNSSVASMVDGSFPALGFSGPDFTDCSGCIARCEAGGPGNVAALSCFADIAATAACETVADPTQIANAVNTCCAGELGSTFCGETCFAATYSQSDLSSFLPVCAPWFELPRPSSCAGTCPAITSATLIPAEATSAWAVNNHDIRDDGSFAVRGWLEAGTLRFGTLPPLTATQPRGFVAMFEADGTPRWAALLPARDDFAAYLRQIAIDPSGNVVVSSTLTGTFDLGGGALTSVGAADLVLASFGPDGTLRWAERFGGPGEEFPAEVALDGAEMLIAASFVDTADYGGAPLVSAGDRDVVVARYATDGSHLWSRRYGSAGSDFAYGIATYGAGDHVIVGGFADAVDFGGQLLTSVGDADCFTARFGDDGTLRWAASHGAELFDFGYEVASDGERTILADFFGSRGNFDYGGETLTGVHQVLASLEPDGTLAWTLALPFSDGGFIHHDIDVDTSGRIAVGAVLTNTLDIGGGPLTSAGNRDAAVASFAADGTHRWSFRMGSRPIERSPSVHRLSSGELAVVGYHDGELDYGAGVFSSPGPYQYLIRFAAE